MDSRMPAQARLSADNAGGYAALTTEFKINLLAPAAGERIAAKGRVVKAGQMLVVADRNFGTSPRASWLTATTRFCSWAGLQPAGTSGRWTKHKRAWNRKRGETMNRWIQLSRCALLVGVSLFLTVGAADAQDYPSKPITIIVPYAAGGPTDTLARQLAPKLTETLGQNVIVETASGGGATIGTGRVARAARDGYTLLLHNLQIAANVSLYEKLPFDTEKDLVPVIFINKNPLVLIGRKNLPPNNLKELLAVMKTQNLKMAHPGAGSTGHLTTVLIEQATQTKFDHIPYRGAAPALQDLLAGHVDVFLPTPQQTREHILSGQVKAYAVTSRGRFAQLPDLPSMPDEINNDKLAVVYWQALFAPAGTPDPVLEKINAAVQKAIEDPAIQKVWQTTGVEPFSADERSMDAAKRLFAEEIQRWGEVIRSNNIKINLQ